LIFNDQLVRALQKPSVPCGVLGFLEERGTAAPFMAVRLGAPLEPQPGSRALQFGHTLLGEPGAEVIQFGVTFFEISTYHLLVNPRNPLVQALVSRILVTGSYFVFVIGPELRTIVFRADLDREDLKQLAEDRRRCDGAKTNAAQYQATVARFARSLVPPGELLEWVPGNAGYLDFTQHHLEMNSIH
jgi:hypothetical protein